MIQLNKKKSLILVRKKIALGILGLFFLAFSITLSISIYVGWNLTHVVHGKIIETPVKYNLKYENISFDSQLDGTNLKGWWISAQNNNILINSKKTVIFAHGYRQTRDLSKIHDLVLAKRFAKEGYNCMLFDFRNSGQSDGKVTSVGLFETYDMLSAIKYAKQNKNSSSISLIGWSMGAAVSIMAGTKSKDVKKIIADSSFADLETYLKTNLSVWSNLPNFPFTIEIMSTLPVIEGLDPEKVSPQKTVKNLEDKKLFLIHSKADTDVPYKNSVQIYNNVKNKANVQLWLTNKASHMKSYLLYKTEYEDKLVKFLNENQVEY
ncbi:alpha/beta hydrolase [Clostridium pasteurianum]|uniref:alpha/beta hydrolase n=1 Tax=Clostridium pasteurianum TaxID=1501 RepID=UPI002260A6E6|nr:alpha/beta hydrolase [Clostridium pasteurianum]UZW14837.1 alpha/beta hydrolase [Clostridium pasteurianum]